MVDYKVICVTWERKNSLIMMKGERYNARIKVITCHMTVTSYRQQKWETE